MHMILPHHPYFLNEKGQMYRTFPPNSTFQFSQNENIFQIYNFTFLDTFSDILSSSQTHENMFTRMKIN